MAAWLSIAAALHTAMCWSNQADTAQQASRLSPTGAAVSAPAG